MTSLAEELIRHTDAIVQRWYEAWRCSPDPRPDLSETALKNQLPLQLRMIGEQLQDLSCAEAPDHMWKIAQRLEPELRAEQNVPIDKVVHEYAIVIDTVRDWLAERGVEVSFQEYSYFYASVFELTAESVRRYAAHQAERARKARARHLAAVMHQLRTPLSAVTLQVDLLERGRQPPDSATVDRLRRNVRRMRTLVEGVLRLERFEYWQLPVRPEPVRPAYVVEDIIRDHEAHAARKGLRLESHIDRSLRITLDPDLFVDVLGNLVQNALKQTTEGFVEVDAEEHTEEITLHVRDSGPGIPPDQQSALFKQVQPGTAGGAGLGLLIAQHAAKAQGGDIQMRSELGKGSVFSFRVPRSVRSRDPSGDGDNGA